jgi:two-component system NarL family sensor kinase
VIERLAPFERGLLFAVRCFAAIRLAFMALALVTHEALHRETTTPDRFAVVLALGTLYALALIVLAVRRPGPLIAWQRFGIVDLALLGALVVYTGGPQSPLRFAYLAIPFLVAFVVRPSRVALWTLSTIACYVAIRWLLGLPREQQVPGATAAEGAAIAFVSLAAVAFSAVLVRLHREISEHADRASALAAVIVRVVEHERRKLADALHDGPVQQIAAASRELAAAIHGDEARLDEAHAALDVALKQLRGEIFDLYPHVLDHAGLPGAVGELTDAMAERGGFEVAVEIDPAAIGVDDVMVMTVLRELLENVVKHARASRVDVWVSNQGGSCLLVGVRDDGCGFEPPSPEQAVAARQFGLHATGERLRALGGSLDVLSVPGTGTDASARIPIARAA